VKIKLARFAGFCPGVNNAIKTVLELSKKTNKKIYTLGPLIHNKDVIKNLEEKNIYSVESIDEIKDIKNSVLVIRAHGIPPQTERKIIESGIEYIDATCPLVKRVHKIIEKYEKLGYTTIILGDPNHAEVIGLKGYAKDPYIITSEKDALNLPSIEKANLVSQTTQEIDLFEKVSEILKTKVKDLIINNTICDPTRQRQKETIEEASKSDLVIVIGGKHSANTQRLHQICKNLSKNAILIENENEIDEFLFKNIETVFDMADDLIAMIKDSPQIPYVLRPLGGYLGKEILKKNIEKSKKIILSTDLLKETYNIPEEKVEIIPNGVDTNLFKNYEEAKKELGLNGFIIGYVGVLREWVDLEPVFKALKILTNKYRDIKMVVVGKEGRFKENIELAEKYEVGEKVIFTGTIPYSQVPKYISVMDVCLIPFKLNKIAQNALPLKLFEYMACEKPVISTEIQGVKRAVGNKVLYASDVREYTEKINMLYEDKRLRGKLGKEGRRFVEENYRGEEIAKRVEDILMRMN